MQDPVGRKTAWIDHFSTGAGLANALVIALGILMLSSGMGKWAYVAWIKDTGAARSPLQYNVVVRFPPASEDLTGSYTSISPWRILAAHSLPVRACGVLLRALENGLRLPLPHIVIYDTQRKSTHSCGWVEDGAALVPTLKETLGMPSPLPTEGFVAVDSTGRVIYGSRNLRHATRLGAVVQLLRASHAGT
jgi:hypothetical protein